MGFKKMTKLFSKKIIDDQILEIENEIKIINQTDLKLDLKVFIQKLNELKIIKYELTDSKKIRTCDHYNKSSNGMKKIAVRTLTKTDQKTFSDPYQLRYNKQLLNLVLGAEK